MSHLASGSPQAPPVACTLAAPGLGTQVERWTKLYAIAGTERIETDDGLRVSFRRNPAVENELRDLVAVEIECCAWADWTIEDGAENLTLEVTPTGDGVDLRHRRGSRDRNGDAAAACLVGSLARGESSVRRLDSGPAIG